jgi:hypothetical protein
LPLFFGLVASLAMLIDGIGDVKTMELLDRENV